MRKKEPKNRSGTGNRCPRPDRSPLPREPLGTGWEPGTSGPGGSSGKPFDHQLLAQRHPIEVQRFRAFLARTSRERVVLQVHVEHEDDGSCCRREPWAVTLLALLGATVPTGGSA